MQNESEQGEREDDADEEASGYPTDEQRHHGARIGVGLIRSIRHRLPDSKVLVGSEGQPGPRAENPGEEQGNASPPRTIPRREHPAGEAAQKTDSSDCSKGCET